MAARIIDGKAFAANVREKVAGHVAQLKADHDITPGLAVVLVGEDPASQNMCSNANFSKNLFINHSVISKRTAQNRNIIEDN